MRDYGKVHTSFWTSPDMRELSEDGRALAIYLLTCPHGTIAGVFRLPDGYVCDDIQWTTERVNKTLSELFHKGFATRCERTKWVWVTKHLEWNQPENPNQIKAAAKMALQVPDSCAWKLDFIRKYGEFLGIEVPQNKPLPNPSETLPEPVTVTVTVAVAETVEEKAPRKRVTSPDLKPDDVSEKTWADWVDLRKKKKTTVSQTAIDEARRECKKADLTLERFLQIWCLRGSQGLQAEWIKPHERGVPTETFKERDARQARARWEEMTGQTHPDNLPKNIIDVIEPMLELTHVESN